MKTPRAHGPAKKAKGASLEEVAAALGCSVPRVQQLQRQALKNFHAALVKRGIDPHDLLMPLAGADEADYLEPLES